MTKEEIAKKYVPCRCDEIYTSRGLAAPDCPYHTTDPEVAMDEWAKQQAIAFMNWTLESGCPYSCTDENQWTNINDTYESITTAQLHDKFIEQQNKKTMTKEQVLGKKPIITNRSGTELYTKRNDALDAIEEFAKQQAIAFGFHVLGADPKDPEMGGVDEMGKTYDNFIEQQQSKEQ
jgi:hypothetical protein